MSRLVVVVLTAFLCLPATEIVMPTVANAISIHIDFGSGGGISSGHPVSCREGERLLRREGFRDIRRIDCRGQNFIYHGSRRNGRYEIAVRSRNGRIVDYRRIGRR